MLGIGSIIDTVADKLGLPEVVGDIAKIGVGIAMKDPTLIADGVIDITPNVCDFLESKLDLGPAEPGEPESFWKKIGRETVEELRKEAEIAEKALPLLGKGAGASPGAGGASGVAALTNLLPASA